MNIFTGKVTLTISLFIGLILLQSFSFQHTPEEKEEKPKNLKVLSKNISHDELISLMKNYSKSLGVKCGFCHVSTGEGKQTQFDFASDTKPTKDIARKMIKMTNTINKKYIDKIGGHKFEKISCVTCHMGSTQPTVSVDSLQRK